MGCQARVHTTPRRPRWKWWVAAGVVLLVCLAALGTWVLPSIVFGESGPQEVREVDREVLITVEDLDPDRHSEFDQGTFSRRGTSSLLGSVHVSYRFYDLAINPERELFIDSEVYIWQYDFLGNSIKADVLWTVMSEHFDQDSARSSPGARPVIVRKLEDLKLGDESLCAVAFRGEEPVGFSFRCRVGLRLLSVDVRGQGFADAAAAEELLAPYVDRLREYRP